MNPTQETVWKSRIVGYGNEEPEQLLANPRNYRIHPKHQQEALSGVLNEVGVVQNIIVNKRTGHVIDGHLRVQLALRQNQKELPITYVDLSETEEAEILATLDPLTALAAVDKQKLGELLRDVKVGDKAVTQMLAKLAEDNGIIPPDFQPVGIDEQGRLDMKKPITCPECGHEFTQKG